MLVMASMPTDRMITLKCFGFNFRLAILWLRMLNANVIETYAFFSLFYFFFFYFCLCYYGTMKMLNNNKNGILMAANKTASRMLKETSNRNLIGGRSVLCKLFWKQLISLWVLNRALA